ncbi:MAG: T9SS type A sorting domain-containing protein [Flavobacteriales bacterium]|nr:T9SS type A sorting domain-containing protein [Flavobacteriales bacterium]
MIPRMGNYRRSIDRTPVFFSMPFRRARFRSILISALSCAPLSAQFAPPNDTLCVNCAFPKTLDYDQDGHIDLILTTPFEDSILWMRNQGDGTFDPADYLTANPFHLTIDLVGDADNDGDGDMIGVTLAPYTDSLVVLLRNNAGTFATEVIDTHIAATRTLTQFADLDGDGLQDALSLQGNDGEIWYRNLGNNAYARDTIPYWCQPVQGPYAVGDIDGDSDLDLIARVYSEQRFYALWNLGNARFGPPMVASSPWGNVNVPTGLAGVHLNEDVYHDVAFGGRALFSNGAGWLDTPSQLPQPFTYQSIANWDCDSVPEVLVSSAIYPPVKTSKLNNITVLYNLTDLPPLHSRTALADLNGDGLEDLLIGAVEDTTGLLLWRPNQAAPLELLYDLPFDTLSTDTVIYLGDPINAQTGDTLVSAWFATGSGVYNDSLYTAFATDGWVTITITLANFNDPIACVTSVVTDSIFIIHTTHIDELGTPLLMIAPNPAHDLATIHRVDGSVVNVWITDALGRTTPAQVVPGSPVDRLVLDVGSMPSGCYMITLGKGDAVEGSARLMVLH